LCCRVYATLAKNEWLLVMYIRLVTISGATFEWLKKVLFSCVFSSFSLSNLAYETRSIQTLPVDTGEAQTESRSAVSKLQREGRPGIRTISENARSWSGREESEWAGDPAFRSVQERTLVFPQATGHVISCEESLESLRSLNQSGSLIRSR
jgi:hypothetical protein